MKNIRTFRQFMWFLVKPIFPYLRDIFLRANVTKVKGHNVRQRFSIGYLKQSLTHEDLQIHLEVFGFYREKMALIDPDEVYGMRKLDSENASFQYHMRLYRDGEIRGHYEKTPEDFPLDHFNEIGFEERRQEFLEMLFVVLEDSTNTTSDEVSSIPEKLNRQASLQRHELSPEEGSGVNQ